MYRSINEVGEIQSGSAWKDMKKSLSFHGRIGSTQLHLLEVARILKEKMTKAKEVDLCCAVWSMLSILKSGVWVQPGKGKKGKGGKGKGKKKGKGRGKGAGEVVGWDGWNQVETDDKKSCMSSVNPHYWQLIFWYYWAALVVVSTSSQTGCPCRSCFCQEKGRRGKRKMMKMRLVDKPWLSGETLNVCEDGRESSCV